MKIVPDNGFTHPPYKSVSFETEKFPPYGYDIKKGEISFGYYSNGEVALMIYDHFDGLYAVPTLNLEDYGLHPQPGRVFIKDYSETAGIHKKLHEMGVISEPVRTVVFGPYNTQAHECEVLADKWECEVQAGEWVESSPEDN